jgi:hypothetical protein
MKRSQEKKLARRPWMIQTFEPGPVDEAFTTQLHQKSEGAVNAYELLGSLLCLIFGVITRIALAAYSTCKWVDAQCIPPFWIVVIPVAQGVRRS